MSIFTGFFNTHLAIWRMLILGNSVAKNVGYKKLHHIEYDTSIRNFKELIKIIKTSINNREILYNTSTMYYESFYYILNSL